MAKHKITLLPGDGIGPEVTASVVSIIECAGVEVEWEKYFVGSEALARFGDPLPQDVLDSILRNKVALKGPVTTPIGTGFTSINVRLRKTLDLYANLRPVKTMPNIKTRYEDVDLIVVRENTEDLYAGLEHEVVPGVVGVDQDHHREGLDAHRAICVRLRRDPRTQARDRRPQGQHHEAVGRPVPAVLPRGGEGVPEHRGRRQDRRQPLHAARHEPESVRHPAAREPLRRHRLRPHRRASSAAWASSAERTSATTAPYSRPCTEARPTSPARTRPTRWRCCRRAVLMLQHIGEMDAARRIHNAILKILESGPEHRTSDIGGTGHTSDFTTSICAALRKARAHGLDRRSDGADGEVPAPRSAPALK